MVAHSDEISAAYLVALMVAKMVGRRDTTMAMNKVEL